MLDAIRQKSQGYTAFRDDVCYGASVPSGNLTVPPDVTLPAMPATGTPPVTITPVANGFAFVGSLVARIKGHAAYTPADGNDLGIEGLAVVAPDPQTTKPVISAVPTAGGKVEVQWKKNGFSGVRNEVDRGTGQWAFLDVDLKPHYTDNASAAAGTTTLWKYRAIYLRGDQVFGQWSDVVSIAVTG